MDEQFQCEHVQVRSEPEGVNVRIGVDIQSVQPTWADNADTTTKILTTRTSDQGARTLQYSARLTWVLEITAD